MLATWRLDRPPTTGDDRPIPAIKIDDHRIAYLDYEGPISGARGSVQRVCSGEVVYAEMTDRIWRFELKGASINDSFQLVYKDGQEWEFHRAVSGS